MIPETLELSSLAVPQVFAIKSYLPTVSEFIDSLHPHTGLRLCPPLVQAGTTADAKQCAGQAQSTLRPFTLASQAGMMFSTDQRMSKNLSHSQRSPSPCRSKWMSSDTL